MMSYNFTDHYDKTFLLKNMMGPNAMRIAFGPIIFLSKKVLS